MFEEGFDSDVLVVYKVPLVVHIHIEIQKFSSLTMYDTKRGFL